jgi:diguanylate cyclase (GGDEF)-like protein
MTSFWSSQRVRMHAWQWFTAAGIALSLGYFLLPSAALQDLVYQVPGMLAVVAIMVGIRLHRPADPRPWITLAAGLALSTAGDWTWVLLDRVYHVEPFPSVADVFYLGGMGVVALAVLRLAKGLVPGGDRASLLDALIVAVGVGMLSWVFLMQPIVADQTQSFGEILVALAYPMLDVVLLAVLVRLVLQPGAQPMSLRLLIGALVAFLVSDFPYAFMSVMGGYETGNIVDLGWMVGAVLWGAAALHPSMLSIGDPVDRAGADQFSPMRLLLLVAASLMGPAVLVFQWVNGEPIAVPVIAAGCVTIFLLVIMRLGAVVDALRATLDERRVLEHELERRALHDPLTGLANRTLFHDRLGHALARRSGSVAVMFLDLDDFKTVNDAYGHAAGDKVLRTVADALRNTLRAEDTVARLGGDEFAVLLADSPDHYDASLVAGRLLEAVQVPVHVAGYEHAIGVSIGISLGRGGEASAETLMRDADIAMYVAKGQGKGTFTVFEPSEHHAVVRGLELRSDLDHAVREHEFELHYQPILSLTSGEVAGVEALVRWPHPTLGLLAPAEFIPLAEATGAIIPLGDWILEEACRTAAGWNAGTRAGDGADAMPPPMPGYVSVNLSAVQLADPGFAAGLTRIVRTTGLSPRQLVLEVTESARLDQDVAAGTLRRIRAAGVRLAIDDFGTGYAAIGQLARMPFDLVKVERSFVANIGSDPRAESLVGGIVDLARRLGVDVVAEGIENGIQLARLREAGCAFGQGFHFAAPMPPAELATFLADHTTATTAATAARRRPVPTPRPT